MSLANIKAKETKGKQKLLPKLKTVLANPIKRRSPTLNDEELKHLEEIIKTSMDTGGIDANKYCTCKHICLGLESSLRAINNQQSSCVFISLSIKPSHIVSLIARNAEVKDETQPVYAQPCLEDFTEKLFGIKALCMVFPKDLKVISEDLEKWVNQRRKPKLVKESKSMIHKKSTRNKTKKLAKATTPEKSEEEKKIFEEKTKCFKGDFISFTDHNVDISKLQLKEDKNEALHALSRIIDKVPHASIKPDVEDKCLPMEIVDDELDLRKPKHSEALSDDSVDFLDEYKSLVVHKIKPNPNKKPKKKRNKNKNKNNNNVKK